MTESAGSRQAKPDCGTRHSRRFAKRDRDRCPSTAFLSAVHDDTSTETERERVNGDFTPTESTIFLMGLVLRMPFYFIFPEKLKCQAKKFTPRLYIKVRAILEERDSVVAGEL